VVIKLLRKDKLRQAISLTKAQQTGKWGALKE
jgi:LPS sulfotransferase NodH